MKDSQPVTAVWVVECKSCSTRASVTVPYEYTKEMVIAAFTENGITIRPFICESCKKGKK